MLRNLTDGSRFVHEGLWCGLSCLGAEPPLGLCRWPIIGWLPPKARPWISQKGRSALPLPATLSRLHPSSPFQFPFPLSNLRIQSPWTTTTEDISYFPCLFVYCSMAADRSLASIGPEVTQRPTESQDHLVPRSCYNCHRRKVRCDKGQPCLRCARVGKTCSYPPTGQRIQRPRKTTIGAVAFRLQPLQKFQPVPSGPSPSSSTSDPKTATPGETALFFGDEIIVQRGSQSQYFNEPLHSRMIEHQKDIQSVLATRPSNATELSDSNFSIYNPMGILSAASPSQPSHSFFPSKQTALKLWNLYLERIDACSGIKILHVPTDEVRLCATIEDPAAAQPEDLAMCYAIFFAAVAVLHPTEAQSLLQQDGDPVTIQSRCKTGFEQALAEAEVLDNPTLPMLCALVLYLSALQLHSRGKGIWVLNGLAIRLAQAMGLHRDGDRLGLSPFQSELRRRVWWHIISRDGRAAEDFGLQGFCSMRYDARMPLNVDDADLHPDMNVLPPPRTGVFTAMTHPLVSFEITRAVRRLASIAAAATPTSPPQDAIRVQIIQEARQRVDELLRGCKPVIPRHRLALLTSRLAIRKTDLVSRQQWLALRRKLDGSRNTDSTSPTEDDLAEALDVLDLTLQISSDEMLRPYSWLWQTNPDYHVVMYLLWHLCVRDATSEEGDLKNVERAWDMIDRWFTENQAVGEGLGHKGAILAALRRKAESLRVPRGNNDGGGVGRGTTLGAKKAQAANDSPSVIQHQEPVVEATGAPWDVLGRRVSLGGEMEWTGELDQVPDWAALVQAFQLDAQDFPGMSWY